MGPSTSPASPSPDPLGLAGLSAFYRWQARIYDWTRPFILFGREAAAAGLECGPGQLVLDVGCGTGVNLAGLAATGASVVGIECTDAMRRRAEARLVRLGLAERVTLDRRPYGIHDGYEGRVDRILFSYSLTMMPPFASILERARGDLQPGGRIAVVDFLDAPAPVAWGLAQSRVHLGGERLQLLRRLFPDHVLRVVDVGLWRYFSFCGRRSARPSPDRSVVAGSRLRDRAVTAG
jgi:S-adenosylmethionine-diacylgycerolhomoserine-N-methlytransferase